MFQIITRSPLDDSWEQRDTEIELAAGRKSNQSGTNGGSSNGYRWHLYEEPEFDEAKLMKERLMGVDNVFVSMREK